MSVAGRRTIVMRSTVSRTKSAGWKKARLGYRAIKFSALGGNIVVLAENDFPVTYATSRFQRPISHYPLGKAVSSKDSLYTRICPACWVLGVRSEEGERRRRRSRPGVIVGGGRKKSRRRGKEENGSPPLDLSFCGLLSAFPTQLTDKERN